MAEQLIRPLYEIAADIRDDWKNMYFGAKPYVDALDALDTIDQRYGAEDAHTVVIYFLANAQTWRGEVARKVKAELKGMAKQHMSGIQTASTARGDRPWRASW